MQNDAPPTDGLPRAWQPLTFRGVAAFTQARLGRLLVVQSLVAVLLAGAVCWFLATIWFPALHTAIRQLPEAGAIENGRLNTPSAPAQVLVETRFLAIVLDPDNGQLSPSAADLRLEFRRTNVAFCCSVGCLTRPYPANRALPFSRPDLEAAWGAWQPMFFAFAALGIVALVFVTWFVLTTIYFPVPWLIAFFKDRRLTGGGAWKLAAASLLPGALLVTVALVLYGLGLISLVQLTLLWVAHLPLGWVFLAVAPRRLPRVADATPVRRRNPFGRKSTERTEAPTASKSPFSKSVDG